MCPKSRPLARTDIRGKTHGQSWYKESPRKEIYEMGVKFVAISMLIAAALPGLPEVIGAVPAYTIEQAVAATQERNRDSWIARKKVVGAHGGFMEARSGSLPWLPTSGLYD